MSHIAKNSRFLLLPVLALATAPALSGCVAVAAGAAVTGISAARQERTLGHAVDDVRIKTEIESDLQKQSAGALVNTSVTVIEGRVLLTGRVDDPQSRLDATRVAWGVDGVLRVNNDIEVTDDVGWFDRPKDIWIRTQLATVLLADASIKDVNYTIDVVDGVVYLTGIGQDRDEVKRAIADAEGLDGVKRVENYVVVKDDPSRFGYVKESVKD
jgi:osmotically-inducible protein OsmY